MFSALFVFLIAIVLCLWQRLREGIWAPLTERCVAVVVFGDGGRSPRMRAHALECARYSSRVLFCAYRTPTPTLTHSHIQSHTDCEGFELSEREKKVYDEKATAERIQFFDLSTSIFQYLKSALKSTTSSSSTRAGGSPSSGRHTKRSPSSVKNAAKFAQSTVVLWLKLARTENLKVVVLQSPPSYGVALLLRLLCLIRGARFVIDCHNLGHTLAALSPSPLLRRAAPSLAWLEALGLRSANRVLVVSRAMQRHLADVYGVRAAYLPDRPIAYSDAPPTGALPADSASASNSTSAPSSETTAATEESSAPSSSSSSSVNVKTKTESAEEGQAEELERIVALSTITNDSEKQHTAVKNSTTISGHRLVVVTSTSYTPDEKLDVFLDALVIVRRAILKAPMTSPLVRASVHAIVTGKGPLFSTYRERINSITAKPTGVESSPTEPEPQIAESRLRVDQLFVPLDAYGQLLECCDLGVSLHVSSSGLCLPMKLYDMIGARLPCVSLDYETLHELITDDKARFNDAPTLASM